MFKEVYSYYKKELTPYNLIFQYIKVSYYFVWVSLICIIFCGIMFRYHLVFLILPLSFLLAALLIYRDHKAKEVLRNKYKIITQGKDWRSGFEELQKKLLKDLLENLAIGKNDIKFLIDITQKEAEGKKFNGYIELGVFLAALITLWSQYYIWYITYLNNKIEILIFTITISIIIVELIPIYIMVRSMFKDIKESESRKMREMCTHLENIYFEK